MKILRQSMAKATVDKFEDKGSSYNLKGGAMISSGAESDAVNLVRFKLDGDGEIVAVGNADPHGHRSFVDVSAHPLFAGSAVVVVRAEPRAKYKVIAELEK